MRLKIFGDSSIWSEVFNETNYESSAWASATICHKSSPGPLSAAGKHPLQSQGVAEI